MTFTNEQMETLSQFESNFNTAINSSYSRGIGTSGYTTMHRILKEATGKNLPFRPSCYSCMFNLVKTTGRYYLADKEEMERMRLEEEHRREVALREIAEKANEKVVVKTTETKKKKKSE